MEHQEHTDRARATYQAYGRTTGHKTPTGGKLPKWDDLDEKHQRAWVKAADQAAAAAFTALADRIDGGAPSGPVTLLMREEAQKLLAYDPRDDHDEDEQAAVAGPAPAGVEGAARPVPQTAAEDAAHTEMKAGGGQ